MKGINKYGVPGIMEHSILIDDEALTKVISSREVIADAIISEYGRA